MPPTPAVHELIVASDPADTRTLAELADAAGLVLTDRDVRFGEQELATYRRRAATT